MRTLIFYAGTLALFVAGIGLVLLIGHRLEVGPLVESGAQAAHSGPVLEEMGALIARQFHHPLALLLAQIVVIMAATRLFGAVAGKIAMPIVVGEIAAGIVLGPSVVGALMPEFSAALFPAASLGTLSMVSQIGLIFFMFVIGMELDLTRLRNQTHASVVISHVSIVFPFFLGVLLAYFLYEKFSVPGVSFAAFALFIGIAMSITAFPVLARIILERGITATRHGAMAITCAAADDATAWYILAIVIAVSVSASLIASALLIALIGLYLLLMIYAARPFLAWIAKKAEGSQRLEMGHVAAVLMVLLLSAFATEVIGIHALFGAFMAGAMMPSKETFKLRERLSPKLEYVSLLVLLPLFFALTGLRTEIGLIDGADQWLACGAIVALAVTGKFFGSAVAARFMGLNWRESFSLGALMNTRGLMELVVLNIGFELEIIGAELFAMFVIMALITTAMTGPLLDLFEKRPQRGVSPSNNQAL